MNVVSATATAYQPHLAAAALSAGNGAMRAAAGGASSDTVTRTGESGVIESDVRSESSSDGPLIGRYPREAFRLDAEAGRLVTLFRNPADGSTVSQIPTQAALKQYKAALQAVRNGHPAQVPFGFGGLPAAAGEQTATGTKSDGRSSATEATGVTPSARAPSVVSSSGNTSSGANAAVSGSAPATGSVGSSVGGPAAGGVNLVV